MHPRQSCAADAGPRPGSDKVFSAWMCCSVGATWTVELRPVGPRRAEPTPAGEVVDWICSGVPTEFPAPDAQVSDLLAPIRARRAEYARDLGYVRQVLRYGNERANQIAAATLAEVQGVMGMRY